MSSYAAALCKALSSELVPLALSDGCIGTMASAGTCWTSRQHRSSNQQASCSWYVQSVPTTKGSIDLTGDSLVDRCRRVHMARPVHQSHAEREGRDAAQRSFARFLSTHLSTTVSPHPACVRFRRSNSRYQKAHYHSPTSVSSAYSILRKLGEDCSHRDAMCSGKTPDSDHSR